MPAHPIPLGSRIRAALIVGCVVAGGAHAQSGDSAMAQILDSIRQQRTVPALGAAFIRGDGSITSAVVGVRKRGTDVRATTEDQWLLGSDTKAMTATLLATFVEPVPGCRSNCSGASLVVEWTSQREATSAAVRRPRR